MNTGIKLLYWEIFTKNDCTVVNCAFVDFKCYFFELAWNIHAYMMMTPHAWLWNLTNYEIIRSILQLTQGLVLKIEIPGLSFLFCFKNPRDPRQSECFIMHVHNHCIRFCHLVIKWLISWTGTEKTCPVKMAMHLLRCLLFVVFVTEDGWRSAALSRAAVAAA